MRQLDAGLRAVMAGRRLWFRGKLELTDHNGMWQDMTNYLGVNWFLSATWSENVDTPVATGTAKLVRTHVDTSIAPYIGGSPANQVAGAYSPFLKEGRGIRLSSAITPAGTAPLATDFHECFIGTYDAVQTSTDDNTITLPFRDLGARVVDAQVRKRKLYAPSIVNGGADDLGMPVETVIANILADAMGVDAPALTTPVATNSKVQNIQVDIKSVLEAVRDVALLIGWDVRYRYDTAGVSRLMLTEPSRAAAAPGTEQAWFAASEYLKIPRLDTSVIDVRNVVRVDFVNVETGLPDSYEARDDVSVAAYGQERWMNLSFSATANINTLVEAQRLADAAVYDMAFPLSDHDVLTFPLFWPAQLGDYYGFRANNLLYDSDQSFGVFGFTHTMENASGSTTFTTKGRVVGAFREWQRRSTSEAGTATTEETADTRALALKNFRELRRTPTVVTYGWDPVGADVAEIWTWGKLSDQLPDPPPPTGSTDDVLWRDVKNDPPDKMLDKTTVTFDVAVPAFGKVQTWELQPVAADHTRGYSQRVKVLSTPDVPRVTSMTTAAGTSDLFAAITALNVVDPQALGGTLKVWLNVSSPDDANPANAPDGTITVATTPRTFIRTDLFTVGSSSVQLFDAIRVHAGAGKRVYFEFVNSSGISSGVVVFVMLGTGGVIDATGQLKDASINRAQQIANSYSLPSVYDTAADLPAVGRTDEIAIAAGELWRWDDTTTPARWTKAVQAPDVAGVLTASQLADHIIDITKTAASIAPPEILSSVAGAPGAGRTGLFNGELYRSNAAGSAWTKAVQTADLSGQINSAQIAAAAVGATQIGANAVQTANLATGAVTNAIIGAGAVSATSISDGAISTPKIAAGAVTAVTVAANAITATAISAGAITTAAIAAGAVQTASLAAGAVTTAVLAAGAVTATNVAANAITAGAIAANAVTAGTVAANAITAGTVAAGAISTAQLVAGAVTANELGANAVTAGKINAGAVTATSIVTGAINSTHINAGAITGDRIATNTLDAAKIITGTITATAIAAGSIDATRLAVIALTETAPNAGIIQIGKLRSIDGLRYVDLNASGTNPFVQHPSMQLRADGTATFSGVTAGTVSATSFTGSGAQFTNGLSVNGGFLFVGASYGLVLGVSGSPTVSASGSNLMLGPGFSGSTMLGSVMRPTSGVPGTAYPVPVVYIDYVGGAAPTAGNFREGDLYIDIVNGTRKVRTNAGGWVAF